MLECFHRFPLLRDSVLSVPCTKFGTNVHMHRPTQEVKRKLPDSLWRSNRHVRPRNLSRSLVDSSELRSSTGSSQAPLQPLGNEHLELVCPFGELLATSRKRKCHLWLAFDRLRQVRTVQPDESCVRTRFCLSWPQSCWSGCYWEALAPERSNDALAN